MVSVWRWKFIKLFVIFKIFKLFKAKFKQSWMAVLGTVAFARIARKLFDWVLNKAFKFESLTTTDKLFISKNG